MEDRESSARRRARADVSARAPRFAPPSLFFKGRGWSSAELTGIAVGWLGFLHDMTRSCQGPPAMILSNHPEAFALFFALSSLPLPLILLPPDPRTWRSSPPVAPNTPLFLPPGLSSLAQPAEGIGLKAHPVPDSRAPSAGGQHPPSFLSGPGFVTFTSGSTGLPKPVYHGTRGLLRQAALIAETYQLPEGCGILGSLPLATHYGLGHTLILPTALRAHVGLVENFDHRSVLAVLARGAYRYWAGTPLMADLLGRAPLPAPTPEFPPVCHVSAGRLSEPVFRAFLKRFDVPLRPSYGRTENGFITADTSAPSDVRPEAVGRPVRGIELRIGDDPRNAVPTGTTGRIWFTSPWYMEGYGFPPHLARESRDGWWPTEDIGVLDDAGYLTLAGRVDDCFKRPSGYLVNPAEIARIVTGSPSVTDAVAVPIPGLGGPRIGVLVEGADTIDPADIRARTAQLLPAWLQPEVLSVIPELPRLPSGKVDRQGCIAILTRLCDPA